MNSGYIVNWKTARCSVLTYVKKKTGYKNIYLFLQKSDMRDIPETSENGYLQQ